MEGTKDKNRTDDMDQYERAQANYMIMQEMWKCYNGSKSDIEEKFYNKIGMDINKFSRIRRGDKVNLDRLWAQKNMQEPLKNIGLSKEIMTGSELIEIEGIEKSEWKQYLKIRYSKKKKSEKTKTDKEVEKAFEKKLADKLKEARENEGVLEILRRYCSPEKREVDESRNTLQKLVEGLKEVRLEDMTNCSKEEIAKITLELLQKRAMELNTVIQYTALFKKENK